MQISRVVLEGMNSQLLLCDEDEHADIAFKSRFASSFVNVCFVSVAMDRGWEASDAVSAIVICFRLNGKYQVFVIRLVFEVNVLLELLKCVYFIAAILTHKFLKIGTQMRDEIRFLLVDLLANIAGVCAVLHVQVTLEVAFSFLFMSA